VSGIALSNGVSTLTFHEMNFQADLIALSMVTSKKDRFHLIGGNDVTLFPYLYGAVRSGKDLVIMPDFIPKIAIEMTKFSLGAGKSARLLKIGPEKELPGGGNVIVFTSGTTGRPKPIVLSPHVLEIDNTKIIRQIGFDPGMSVFTPAPMLAAPTAYAMYLSVGATVNTLPFPTADPWDVARGFAVSGADVLACTPSTFEKVYDSGAISKMPSLKAVHLVTSPVPMSLIRKIAAVDVPVIDLYLSSETGPIAWRDLKQDLNFTLFDGVEPMYEDGPLCLAEPKSEHAKGWYSRSGIIPMKYPLTNGDTITMKDGKITSILRSKVKIAGFAVDPKVLLDEAARIDGVIDASVDVVRSERSDSLELVVESSLSEHEIKRVLSERLPWYYIPRRITHVI
jgi:AMP-binding enzyme